MVMLARPRPWGGALLRSGNCGHCQMAENRRACRCFRAALTNDVLLDDVHEAHAGLVGVVASLVVSISHPRRIPGKGLILAQAHGRRAVAALEATREVAEDRARVVLPPSKTKTTATTMENRDFVNFSKK